MMARIQKTADSNANSIVARELVFTGRFLSWVFPKDCRAQVGLENELCRAGVTCENDELFRCSADWCGSLTVRKGVARKDQETPSPSGAANAHGLFSMTDWKVCPTAQSPEIVVACAL